MESELNNKAADSFAAAFASCFGDALTHALGARMSFSVRESPDLSTRNRESVHFRVAVEGLEHADCFIELDKPNVIALGSKLLGEDSTEFKVEHAHALQQLIANTFPELTSKLAAGYGGLALSIEPVSDLVFGGMLVIPLVGEGPEQPSIPVLLYFDSRFHRAFSAGGSVTPSGKPDLRHLDIRNLDLVMDVELNVSLRFGQRQMPLREILELESGSVIELDRKVDDPIELLLDGKVIARGEAVIVDGNYGLRVTEVPNPIASHLNA